MSSLLSRVAGTRLAIAANMLAERELLRLLIDISNLSLANLDYPHFLSALSAAIQPVVRHERISLAIYDRRAQELRVPMTYVAGHGLTAADVSLPLDRSPEGVTLQHGYSRVFGRVELEELGLAARPTPFALERVCCVPLPTGRGPLGVLSVTSGDSRAFTAARVELLVQASASIAAAIGGIQCPGRTMHRKPT